MVDDARVTELTRALETKAAEIQAFMRSDAIKVDGNNVVVSGEDAAKVKAIKADMDSIKSLIEAEKGAVSVKDWLNGGTGSHAVQAAAYNEALKDTLQGKSLGHAFTSSEEFKKFQPTGLPTMPMPFEIEAYDLVGRSERKDVYNNLDPHGITLGIGTRPQFDPVVPRGQRQNRVRDLFPVATTNNNLIDFFRVAGFVENGGNGNAQMVADYSGGAFGLKPKSNINFTPAQAPVRTIAHWEAAHRNVIQDVPQLQATINNELLYGLALVEDYQLLLGDGNGENLLGVLNTPGIQLYTPTVVEPKADSLRKAQTLSVIANYPPTGYVVHPNDWEDIELDKGTTNDHYRIVTNIAVGAEARVWRLPVVETPAMPEGTFLSGAFGTGAQVYDRQQANVRIAEQHSDFFVRNAVVILVEERLTIAVKRPESFVKGGYKTS